MDGYCVDKLKTSYNYFYHHASKDSKLPPSISHKKEPPHETYKECTSDINNTKNCNTHNDDRKDKDDTNIKSTSNITRTTESQQTIQNLNVTVLEETATMDVSQYYMTTQDILYPTIHRNRSNTTSTSITLYHDKSNSHIVTTPCNKIKHRQDTIKTNNSIVETISAVNDKLTDHCQYCNSGTYDPASIYCADASLRQLSSPLPSDKLLHAHILTRQSLATEYCYDEYSTDTNMDCLQKTVPHQILYSTTTETNTNPKNPYHDYTSSTIICTILNNKITFPYTIKRVPSDNIRYVKSSRLGWQRD